MPTVTKRSRRRRLLAAPFVATAALTPACGGPTYTNPGPPTLEPTATATVAEPDPTVAPTATATAAPTTTATTATVATGSPTGDALPDAPNDGSGRLERRADGTCVYLYDPPPMKCPPGAMCNPGPPRAPLPVKCPAK